MNEQLTELLNEAWSPKTAQFTCVGNSMSETRESLVNDLLPILEKFSTLIVLKYANHLVQANMSNHEYAQAMDAYYEKKWAHRFD